MHPRAGKQGHGDGEPEISKPQISNTTTPDKIYFTAVPGSCVPRRRSSNSVGPFHSWPSQLKNIFQAERKHESVIPRISTYRESSVSGHVHLSPVDASQSSVDTHIRKGERRISMPKLPQCGNFMEPALSRRLNLYVQLLLVSNTGV
jgi:hypothetical protein